MSKTNTIILYPFRYYVCIYIYMCVCVIYYGTFRLYPYIAMDTPQLHRTWARSSRTLTSPPRRWRRRMISSAPPPGAAERDGNATETPGGAVGKRAGESAWKHREMHGLWLFMAPKTWFWRDLHGYFAEKRMVSGANLRVSLSVNRVREQHLGSKAVSIN